MSPISKAVGDLQNSLNLTQAELSRLTGVHRVNLSKMRSGAYVPTFRLLQRIADATGTELRIEFTRKENPTEGVK